MINRGKVRQKCFALLLGDTLATPCFYCFISVVPRKRLELLHLAAPEPKSGASTNFATWAGANFLRDEILAFNCR